MSLLQWLRDLWRAIAAARRRECTTCFGWGEVIDRGTSLAVACPTCCPDAYGGPDD